jgi:SAM-dependent methyltransferase
VRWLRAETSLPIALLHLVASFTDADALLNHLDESAPALATGVESERLASLRAFVGAHRDGIALVRRMGALHARAEAELPSHGVGALRGLYDELAELDPGTAVALYAFGDARILAEATREVVAYLKERGSVGPTCRLLDLGCGIGRLLEACAPLCRSVTGADVSPRMVALAAERVAAFPQARVQLVGGRELRDFADASFDLVLAADSWPHVLSLGTDASRALAREVARVLGPGGEFVLLNYSYGGDPETDARDVAALAAGCGFTQLEAPAQPFALWDATAFRLRRSAGIP